MSVGAVLRAWTRRLQQAGVSDARVSASHLLAAALQTSVADLPSRTRQPFIEACGTVQAQNFENACRQRMARVPLQYLLGEWDFRHLTLVMKQPVLIPRPETEQLAGLVLAMPRLRMSMGAVRVLDIGCGSGALSLALLDECPWATAVAVDVDGDAVALTRENAVRWVKSCSLILIRTL